VFFAMFAAAGFQAWKDFRQRQFTRAQLALAWGMAVMLAMPFAPDQLNGSYVFADRLSVWSVLLIAAAAASAEIDARVKPAILAACWVTSMSSLIVLNSHMRPIAQRLDVAQIPANAAGGEHALLVHRSEPPKDLSYDPYVWAGVRVVERQRAVLIDAPWLDLSIIMLKPTADEKEEDAMADDSGEIAKRLRSGGMVVVTHCGQPNPPPESWVQVEREWRTKYYPGWKAQSYSCFEVLRP
jgi:hypothetical protein